MGLGFMGLGLMGLRFRALCQIGFGDVIHCTCVKTLLGTQLTFVKTSIVLFWGFKVWRA